MNILKCILNFDKLSGRFYLTMRYIQLAAIKQTALIRTQCGSGLERDGTDHCAVVQITAIGAPTTKSRPAAGPDALLI